MLTVIATIRVKPGHEAAARAILHALIEPTLAEDGCVSYDLHQRQDQPDVFVFVETWTSKAALDAHLQTPHLKTAQAAMQPIEAAPPDIGLFTLIPRGG